MTDGVFAFNALAAAACLAAGEIPEREGFILNGGSLYDFYKTADNQYLGFGGMEPQFFAAFCQAIGRPDLIAGGVMPPDLSRVKEEIRTVIRGKTKAQWEHIFDHVEACVEPVISLPEAINSALAKERGWTVEVALPDGGAVRQPACPFKFSATPAGYGNTGVRAGTHNRKVFLDLGYGDEEIDEFQMTGLFS